MSDYSENLDFSPTRQAKIAACEKLRDTVTGISALHKSLLDESLASSPSHRNSFSEIYRMSTQAMAMKKEEMTSKNSVSKPLKERNNIIKANTMKKSAKLKESTKIPSNWSEEDVHDAFGKYVASELRAIHEAELLLETKLAIQGILNDACIIRYFIMADDPERDIFPTKEGRNLVPSIDLSVQGIERHISPEKRYGHHLSRTDLEDQFYKFKEENLQLKKAAKKQEEELKRLATKMTRLLREKKSMELTQSPGHKRDLELEEMVEDLQDRIRQLEKTNSHLREKVLVAKQQVIMQARRPNPYSHIQPKVNSGNFKLGNSPYVSSVNLRGKNLQNSLRKSAGLPIPSYALGLLEEARAELSNLKLLVTNQRNEIEMYQQENEVLKQNMRLREIEFDDELNILKSQLTEKQRQHVQENLDLIRLHRELKQKNTKIMGLQAQYNDMEEKMRILKLNHDHLVKDMDDLALHFKNEQKKNIELLGELKKAEITISASSELHERIKSLVKENDILRETNEKLLQSALAVEKERSFSQLELIYKEKISSLESALEVQTRAKSSLEEELIKEKSSLVSKEEVLSVLNDQIKEMKIHMEEMETKTTFLKSENVELDDLQEALELLKLKKEGKLDNIDNAGRLNNTESKITATENAANRIEEIEKSESKSHPTEIENTDETKFAELENLKSRLKMVETEHLETLQELDNVREMLTTQYDLNKVAQDELKLLSKNLEEQQKESQTQLQECSHLLDLRAARIQEGCYLLDVQPNTFCVYKFYDLPDQDTVIVPASNNPEYSDHHIFSLFVDPLLEKYILTQSLNVYVFDDNDPDISNYIGRASIPLQPLAQNKPIKGIFELQKDDWSDVMSDTEKKASYEETTDQEKQDLSYEDSDDSESDDYSVYRPKQPTDQAPNIVICVSHLQLRADAAVLKDSLIKLLYVEYRFLDYPLEELETPFSLPKKGPPEKIVFNFEKVRGGIRFTVVSEPLPDEQSLDCEDIGYGSVDLHEILDNKQDKIQEDVLIYDARNTDTVIGTLNVSIKALDALLLLQTFAEF
ncbi:protein fantom [Trichonephila inaurata madagascariensis]|uniref:Protein fantom n=1 Tax=Trichonephila inaurata madagascariensis TaxID=2747483 RepID=A0A8X7C8Z5_9ARAC|nr:protein fantom [Trichonephila inaurata madagascariensis]